MLGTLIRKEILNNLLNLRFGLAYFLCTALIVGSFAIMLTDFVNQKKMHDVDKSVFERRLLATTQMWDYMTMRTVVRPPVVTQILAQGGEKDPDQYANMHQDYSPAFYGSPRRNPMGDLFPTVDMAFITGVILSLLVFLLTYDSLAGEREDGTLKVLLAGAVPRDQVIIAKWLGCFVTLVLPCATAWAMISVVLALAPSVTVTPDHWVRIGCIFAASCLYLAAVLSLSMMVSALFLSSTTVMLGLLLVWVVGIIALPSLSTPLAYLAMSPPAVQRSELAANSIGTGVTPPPANPAVDSAVSRALAGRNYDKLSHEEQHRIDSIGEATGNYRMKERLELIRLQGQTIVRSMQQVDGPARWIARLSPFGCYENACVTLAGTGMDHEAELRDAASRHAADAYWYGQQNEGRSYPFRPTSTGPQFQVPGSKAAAAISKSLPDAGILGLMGILFFMIAFIRFVRMEVA
jgi:ABC-type transport system involved in multi-copper enzyme maturation permease subunit